MAWKARTQSTKTHRKELRNGEAAEWDEAESKHKTNASTRHDHRNRKQFK